MNWVLAKDEYSVWFRHSEMPPQEEGNWMVQKTLCTMEQIKVELQGHTMTHMWTEFKVPPNIHRLALNMTHFFGTHLSLKRDLSGILGLSKLTKLKELNIQLELLEDNSTLPDIFPSMASLKHLRLDQCGLSKAPKGLSKLTALEVLQLPNNKFTVEGLPEVITDMASLKELNVSSCHLTRLPESLGKLADLQILNVSDNDFTDGIPEIFASMTSLRELVIIACHLKDLPASIGCLTKLIKLDLSGNKLINLPVEIYKLTSLEELNLYSNKEIKSIDSKVLQMTSLTSLILGDNGKLKSPPPEIWDEDIDVIKEFYRNASQP